MFKYSINLTWSDEDDSYVATVPEFPGLSAFGETPEEAVKEAKIAVKGFVEVFKEDGEEIPEPNKLKPFSGQIRLRLPKSLHSSLSSEAKSDNVSLNTYIVQLLSEKNSLESIKKEIDSLNNNIRNLFLYGREEIKSSSQIYIGEGPSTPWDDKEIKTTITNILPPNYYGAKAN